MKLSIFALVAAIAVPSALYAQPYCDALMDASALEKKYQRLAPIHSSRDTGWIITSDHLDEKYALKPDAIELMTEIVGEFDKAGVDLAVMIAPPRAVVAGAGVVSSTLGQGTEFDLARAKASFELMISQVQETGAIAPDLLAVALNDGSDSFLFKRDTHWTNTGAALSANALAKALDPNAPGIDIGSLPIVETVSERGSLSDIVNASCGTRDAGEATPIYDYASLNDMGLLDETVGKRVALLGSSFSNRYKRDAYQVADAIATALGADVENFSKSGGGLMGPIEAYVLSGALAKQSHDLVVWEFSSTETLNSTDSLRQLLGALRLSQSAAKVSEMVTLSDKGHAELTIASDIIPNLVVIENTPVDTKQVSLDLRFADGEKITLKLRRKSSMSATMENQPWVVDLTGLDAAYIRSIKIRLGSENAGETLGVKLASRSSSGKS